MIFTVILPHAAAAASDLWAAAMGSRHNRTFYERVNNGACLDDFARTHLPGLGPIIFLSEYFMLRNFLCILIG